MWNDGDYTVVFYKVVYRNNSAVYQLTKHLKTLPKTREIRAADTQQLTSTPINPLYAVHIVNPFREISGLKFTLLDFAHAKFVHKDSPNKISS